MLFLTKWEETVLEDERRRMWNDLRVVNDVVENTRNVSRHICGDSSDSKWNSTFASGQLRAR